MDHKPVRPVKTALVLLCAVAAALLSLAPAASASVGSYCGHGSTSHWHWLTWNGVTFRYHDTDEIGYHWHKYDLVYVAPTPQSWDDTQWKRCYS